MISIGWGEPDGEKTIQHEGRLEPSSKAEILATSPIKQASPRISVAQQAECASISVAASPFLIIDAAPRSNPPSCDLVRTGYRN